MLSFISLIHWAPIALISATLANLAWLGLYSLFPLIHTTPWLATSIYSISLILIGYFLPKAPFSSARLRPHHVALLLVFVLVACLRAPMVYPTYDDFAAHFMMGDYARTLWNSSLFMPLDFGTYFPPFYDMNYTVFLKTIGIRATILFFDVLISAWMISLLARFELGVKHRLLRTLLVIIFVTTFFYPHLMATHGTLMTDYVAVAVTLETLYLLLLGMHTATLGVIVALLSLMIKQSTVIFLVPLFLYYIIKKRQEINWKPVVLTIFLATLYFVKLWSLTGNPLFGLYNSVFESALYPLSDFKNPLFGPLTWWQTLLWPIIAQFGDRYGEGAVGPYARLFFSWIPLFGYLGSLWFMYARKSLKYGVVVLCYLLWSAMAGYSRYYIALNTSVLVMIVLDLRLLNTALVRWVSNYRHYLLIVILFLSLSSLKSDFSWRPYPSLRTPSANHYFWSTYTSGFQLMLHDTMPALARELAPILADHDAVVTAFRGQSSLIAYLAYLVGLDVYNGVTPEKYSAIMSDPKISMNLKNNLRSLASRQRVLLLADADYMETAKTLTLHQTHICDYHGLAPASRYLQRDYFYTNVNMYECVKK